MISRVAFLVACLALMSGAMGAILPSQCTIITNPEPLPPQGIIGGSPARMLYLVETYWDWYNKTIDFRGYQLYVGEYKGMPIFAMNHEIGAPGAAFILEELIAHGVTTVIRVGTSDIPVTVKDLNKIYIIRNETGMVGLLRDYGYPPENWDDVIPAHPTIIAELEQAAALFPNITAYTVDAYLIDGYFAYNFPTEAAYDPVAVKSHIASYQARYGNTNAMLNRDMEMGAVFMIGRLRGLRYGGILQCSVKGGNQPEQPGVNGLPVALTALHNLWLKEQVWNRKFSRTELKRD